MASRFREDLQWLAGRPGRPGHVWYRWQEEPPGGVNLLDGFGVFNGVARLCYATRPYGGERRLKINIKTG